MIGQVGHVRSLEVLPGFRKTKYEYERLLYPTGLSHTRTFLGALLFLPQIYLQIWTGGHNCNPKVKKGDRTSWQIQWSWAERVRILKFFLALKWFLESTRPIGLYTMDRDACNYLERFLLPEMLYNELAKAVGCFWVTLIPVEKEYEESQKSIIPIWALLTWKDNA